MADCQSITPNAVSRFPIFAGLSAAQLAEIACITQIRKYASGEEITREGDEGHELYLLLSGKVEVSKSLTLLAGRADIDAKDKSLIQLKAEDGPYFGEIALLNEASSRSATVKALTDCLVGIISRQDFMNLCQRDKELGFYLLFNIAKTLASRLEKTNQDVLKLTTAFSLALQS
jgi:CRP/FNR family transcriptional regulator, cyclic AMP receptor protein